MVDVLLMAMWWQVLLLGWWAASRRLRRLERNLRPPCYEQVGALRQQVVALRTEQASDASEQAMWMQDVEDTTAQLGEEVHMLLRQQQRISRELTDRLAQFEQSLGTRTAAVARPSARLARSGS